MTSSAFIASHSWPPHCCFLPSSLPALTPCSGLLPGNFGFRSGSSPISGHFCSLSLLYTPSLTILLTCSVHLPPRISKPPDGYPQPACLQVQQVKKGTRFPIAGEWHLTSPNCTRQAPGTLATLLCPLPSASHPSSASRASQSVSAPTVLTLTQQSSHWDSCNCH